VPHHGDVVSVGDKTAELEACQLSPSGAEVSVVIIVIALN
jgi:hypothetical protein